MDANYFRRRAESARQMAECGNDPQLYAMLLDVAADFDAEAEAIEAATRHWHPADGMVSTMAAAQAQ